MASTQFRSDDTTKWWVGYGNGSDGDYSSVGNATDAPVDSSCSGTVDTTSLTATNASFAVGKPILIHQTRGTGAGNYELNQIAAYTAGTITTVSPLKNTYTDSGASQAQVIQLKQYNNFTQNSGHTLYVKNWSTNVGGIFAFLARGTVTITGNITDNNTSPYGAGFIGNGALHADAFGGAGEGHTGASVINQNSANGSGGGGGGQSGDSSTGGGGGGGHAASGTTGTNPGGNAGGVGGGTSGNAGLTTMTFGGGGGGTGNSGDQNIGGYGGFISFIIAPIIVVTGTINVNGKNGDSAMSSAGGGGGGAGGSVLLKCITATLGTSKVTANAGNGGSGSGAGGNGSVGRIHIDYADSYTGTTTPTIDARQDTSLYANSSGNMFLLF